MSKHISASDIRAAMRHAYCQPEWALFFEVRDGTGGRATRSADAVAMSLWPSRGLELHGFEIKVSRSDWKREAADPTKAEAVAAYCDRWWIAAPPDVVPEAELPPAWGLRVWDGRCWRVKREATKTDAKPLDRNFLAAMLRQAHKADEAEIEAVIAKRVEGERQSIQAKVEQEVKRRSYKADAIEESLAKFEAASGVKIDSYDGERIGEAVKIVQAMRGNPYEGAFYLIKQHERFAADIRNALAEVGIADPEQPATLKLVGGT